MSEQPYVGPEAWSNLGKETEYTSDPVSLRHIKEYLAGTDDWDPRYLEEGSAPPLFFLAACREVVAEGELQEDGQYKGFVVPGVHGRSMVGEHDIQVFARVRVGDVITAREKVVDIQEKQGRSGKLIFVSVDGEYTNQTGELIAKARQTFIFR